MKKKNLGPAIRTILVPMAVLAVLLFFFAALSNLQEGRSSEGREQLETSIRRACAACYAIEGFYPPSLDYIRDNFGVLMDTDRYGVFYEIFAENIMPQISVTELPK